MASASFFKGIKSWRKKQKAKRASPRKCPSTGSLQSVAWLNSKRKKEREFPHFQRFFGQIEMVVSFRKGLMSELKQERSFNFRRR
jgi:hypothetical protein